MHIRKKSDESEQYNFSGYFNWGDNNLGGNPPIAETSILMNKLQFLMYSAGCSQGLPQR